ncbi:unnamed protein product [Rotaria sordida]|uniref:Ubiquitin carboxyl-terminal hydrolase n=1 Tax=Rotaria sordida TaxID=392033 RepID=A0A814RLK7_9BILA|nr:unnamed protein product [Rotaria sordida]CAF1134207.1 unnamed protein product [Rotaria sordida]
MSNTEESSDRPVDEQNKSHAGHLRSNSYDRAVSGEHSKINDSIVENPSPKCDKKLSEIKQIDNDIYIIKWIEFNHERVPILLQNVNGPCPLLAIANILLLRQRIRLNPNAGAISTEHVIAMIAEYILQIDTTKLSADDRANYEQNVADALSILPKLQTGLNINLKFNGVDKFEYTRECIVFDLLGIQLFHGWVIDPQNNELQKIVNTNGSSYNQLVEKMIRQKQSNNEELARESLLIEQFLDENRSQLTHYGILQLHETMRDNQLAVFFRNNHFSTIWKNNKQLLLLVSDEGFANHTSIVFETLTDIDNDSSFTDGYGQKWQKPVPVDVSRDHDLAIAIHNEERSQHHEASIQQQQQQQQQQHYHPQQQRYAEEYYCEQSSGKYKKKHRRRSHDEDRDSSCILS